MICAHLQEGHGILWVRKCDKAIALPVHDHSICHRAPATASAAAIAWTLKVFGCTLAATSAHMQPATSMCSWLQLAGPKVLHFWAKQLQHDALAQADDPSCCLPLRAIFNKLVFADDISLHTADKQLALQQQRRATC
jgi:hypothetical protein